LKRGRATNNAKTGTAFALLVLLILPIYSNTFHASWQFDDKPNILDNTRLHLTDLSPPSLWNTFFAGGGKNVFSRPLPSLSLALNWYVGQEDTFGYHLVNIAVHILTAFILSLSVSHLLQTPRIKNRCTEEEIYSISLLCAVLWAVNPIQIQAVTYIVQRMAAMAAMFYILGIYFYIKGRQTQHGKTRALFYVLCFFSFLFALLSKENAVMLPISLILMEMIFYRDLTKLRKKQWLILLGTVCTAILLGIVIFKIGILDFLFRGFISRPFSLGERLLTEPRIVLFYISQIFYPLPDRLSITHDIIVSTSLLSPWTTLPAILTILLLIGIGISQINKRPVVAFSILFFFLNHVIESTILPLELIFEHRNYLPSFFIFLPIASGLTYLFGFYKAKNRPLYAIMATFVTLIIIGLGCFTYIRNRDWRTETTLWKDAMKKAPRDARPVCNLAIQLAWGANPTPLHYDVALAMFERAMSLNKAHNFLVTDIFNNIGIIYYHRGAYQKAVETYQKGLEIDPGFNKMRYDLISSLIMLGKWEEGAQEADWLIANTKTRLSPDYYKLKGFILLWQDQPEEALVYFRKVLEVEPNNRAVLLNTGVALSLMGDSSQAELFLIKAGQRTTGDIRPVYALIENSIRAGNQQKIATYVAQMFAQFNIQTIIDGFDILTENYRTAPMSPELIIPVVKKKMLQLIEDMQLLIPPSSIE
jgi:tetratricopeptide (TPR) repeat protein